MPRRFLLLLFLLLLPFEAALAVNCHCFNQRDFDPANPGSSDPYVLATAGNSLLAAYYSAEKAAVVRFRMGGETETDLWLAFGAARAAGSKPEAYLEERAKAGGWAKVMGANTVAGEKLGAGFAESFAKGEGEGARFLAEGAMKSLLKATEGSLAELKGAGASIPEATVALYLAMVAKVNPKDALVAAKAGGATWGRQLADAGVPTAMLSKQIMKLTP